MTFFVCIAKMLAQEFPISEEVNLSEMSYDESMLTVYVTSSVKTLHVHVFYTPSQKQL